MTGGVTNNSDFWKNLNNRFITNVLILKKQLKKEEKNLTASTLKTT